MNLDTTLTLLARDPTLAVDLTEVALHLARDEYPALDVAAYLGEIDAMAHEVRPQLRGSLETQVESLGRYLFHEMGFQGNHRDYYDPRNSYLNEVLDRRLGLPISLSILAMEVGRRAGLRVEGVGLPGHFVVKAVGRNGEILFDPFHGGQILSQADCETLVHQVTNIQFEATPERLTAAPAGGIVQRMLNNLKGIYLGQRELARAARVISRLVQLLPDDIFQQRDLGATLLHAGRPGKALKHLEAYMEARPQAGDAADVLSMIRLARSEIARLN